MIKTSTPIIHPRPKTASSEQEVNFLHLYLDSFWHGLTVGSVMSFLAVFITRRGAVGWQVGLLNAGFALLSLGLTLPVGRWLENQPLGVAVTKSAMWYRLGFFLLIPLPLVLPENWQILY